MVEATPATTKITIKAAAERVEISDVSDITTSQEMG